MRILLTLLLVLSCAQATLAETRLVMVDGYCYLEGQSEHSETKVKFIKDSPSAITDSTYTDSSGYFFITDLYEGIYDIEYTHAGFDTIRVEDQVLVSGTTLPPVTLLNSCIPISGVLSGVLGPGYYAIIGDISVNSGDSLQLCPRTIFRFYGPYPFRISGTLLAEGTQSDSIKFTTDTLLNPDRWRGLRFESSASSGSRLAYCLVEKSCAVGIYPDNYGGGAFCDEYSSPTFTNCTFRQNSAHHGGGVFCVGSSASFTNCTFRHNSADYGGGACCYGNPSPTFTKCTFMQNSAVNFGGGLYCHGNSSATFKDCIVADNLAGLGGGGVYCKSYAPTFANCTFSHNSAYYGAGVYCYDNSSPNLNSTIIAYSTGAGIYFYNSASSQISYCDIFGNSEGNFQFYSNDPSQGPLIIGRLVTTNVNGDSCDTYFNILLDPMFSDTATGDYHLTDYSHCIGAGDPADTVSTDFEGDPRPSPSWSYPDIGADEHWSGSPVLHLVVSIADGNARLHWTPFGAGPYYIYGATTPFIVGTLLGTVSDTTTWTDEETASRPWRYFYYVMLQESRRSGEGTRHGK